jgi:hypothetical protein
MADRTQEPKCHHYVHRAYLEGFLDPDLERIREPFLWMYMGNKFPFRQRPERVAKRNYYYCYRDGEKKSFEAEHNLQKLEDLALRRALTRDFAERVRSNRSGLEMCVQGIQHLLACLMHEGVQLDGGASLSIGSAARESPPFHTAKILVVRRGSWVAGTAGHRQRLHEE